MGVTTVEKEHFRKRIMDRADTAIENAQAGMEVVERDVAIRAKQALLAELDLGPLLAERAALEAERDALMEKVSEQDDKIEAHEAKFVERIAGSASELMTGYCSNVGLDEFPTQVQFHLQRMLSARKERVLQEHPSVKHVNDIKEQRDQLIDRLLMCSSRKELQEVWTEASEVFAVPANTAASERTPRKVSTTRKAQSRLTKS